MTNFIEGKYLRDSANSTSDC